MLMAPCASRWVWVGVAVLIGYATLFNVGIVLAHEYLARQAHHLGLFVMLLLPCPVKFGIQVLDPTPWDHRFTRNSLPGIRSWEPFHGLAVPARLRLARGAAIGGDTVSRTIVLTITSLSPCSDGPHSGGAVGGCAGRQGADEAGAVGWAPGGEWVPSELHRCQRRYA